MSASICDLPSDIVLLRVIDYWEAEPEINECAGITGLRGRKTYQLLKSLHQSGDIDTPNGKWSPWGVRFGGTKFSITKQGRTRAQEFMASTS